MELQIIIYIILFLFFNGLFFVNFQVEIAQVRQHLLELIQGCKRVENGTFFHEGIPEDTHQAQKWANEKLEDKNWIFWSAVINRLDENKIILSIINTIIFTSCFILPKYF